MSVHKIDAGLAIVTTVPGLLDEIQTLTRHQGRVELSTKYFAGYAPGQTDHPMAVFRKPDPECPDWEIDTPYYVAIKSYGIEALGATWEEALRDAAAQLRAAVMPTMEDVYPDFDSYRRDAEGVA